MRRFNKIPFFERKRENLPKDTYTIDFVVLFAKILLLLFIFDLNLRKTTVKSLFSQKHEAQTITIRNARYENPPHPLCTGGAVSGEVVTEGEAVVSESWVDSGTTLFGQLFVASGWVVSGTLSPFT